MKELKNLFIDKHNNCIEDIFLILQEYQERNILAGKNEELNKKIDDLKHIKNNINLKVLAQIKTNSLYKKLIFSGKYNSKDDSIKKLIVDIENIMNKKTKEAVKHPTKLKREKEKNIVMSFLIKNKYNIKNILNFLEKIEEFKEIEKNANI